MEDQKNSNENANPLSSASPHERLLHRRAEIRLASGAGTVLGSILVWLWSAPLQLTARGPRRKPVLRKSNKKPHSSLGRIQAIQRSGWTVRLESGEKTPDLWTTSPLLKRRPGQQAALRMADEAGSVLVLKFADGSIQLSASTDHFKDALKRNQNF